MKIGICPLCSGKTKEEIVEVEEKVNGELILVRGVHAEVCEQCGERMYSQEELKKIEGLREKIQRGVTKPVEIQKIEIFAI